MTLIFIIQLEIVQIIKKRKYSAAINLLQFPKIHRKKTVPCPKQDKKLASLHWYIALHLYKSILQHKNTLSQERLYILLSNTTLNNWNINRNYIHLGKYTQFRLRTLSSKRCKRLGRTNPMARNLNGWTVSFHFWPYFQAIEIFFLINTYI